MIHRENGLLKTSFMLGVNPNNFVMINTQDESEIFKG
jgi:hypothetical protein